MAQACDHIGLCVVNDADVLDVCGRLVPAMKPGSLLALHSTVLPETAAQVESLCAASGIKMVDAPVSGGAPGAEAGTMTVMCGGRQEAFDQARPVFESFGKLIVHRPTRAEAIAAMRRALGEFHIAPIKSTIPLHLQIMDNTHFQSGDVDTGFIERVLLAH